MPQTTGSSGFLYLAPALLFVAVFVFYPLSQLVTISLTSESLLGGGEFVGLDNYLTALNDRNFWRAFWFTVTLHALHHAGPDRSRASCSRS